MNDKKIRKLVLAALLAALVCVATMVVQIPSPMQGYVNLGDCFVLLSGRPGGRRHPCDRARAREGDGEAGCLIPLLKGKGYVWQESYTK